MRLVLVYNADAGVFGAVADSVHKLLAPETYACGLCYYTHGAFGMKRPFKDFLERLPVAYHLNAFRRQHGDVEVALPAVLWEARAGTFEVVVPAEALAVDPAAEEAGMEVLMGRIEAAVRERLGAA